VRLLITEKDLLNDLLAMKVVASEISLSVLFYGLGNAVTSGSLSVYLARAKRVRIERIRKGLCFAWACLQ